VTATRNELDARLVPLRTDGLSSEKLAAQAPLSTGSALVQAPGITPVGSGPMQERPRLRGLDSTRLLVLVDGQRLNHARTATDRAGTEVSLVDLNAIEGIEIVGGAGSVLYGTDALAGTINIITSRPQLTDGLRFSYGLDGYYSSNEDGRRGTTTFGVSHRRFAFQVQGTLESYGDYRAGRNWREDTHPLFEQGVLEQADTIDDSFGFDFNAFPDPFNAPFRRTSPVIPGSAARGNSLSAAGVVALTAGQTLQVKYLRRRMDSVGFPDFEPPAFFQRVYLPYSNLDRISAQYEVRQLAPWLAAVRVSAYLQEQNRLLRNEFPVQFPVPSARFFPINVYRLDIRSDTQQNVRTPGFDAQATMIFGGSHIVTAGAMLYRDRSEDARTTVSRMSLLGNVDLGERGPVANVLDTTVPIGPTSTSHPMRVPRASFSNAGVFLQDEWHLSEAFQIVAGMRLDRYRVRTDPTPGYDVGSVVEGADPPIDPDSLPSASGDRIARRAFTGDVGLVYRPGSRIGLYARYGRSYRHPNLEELLFSGPATVGSIAPNLKVKPEVGNNVDLGIRVRGEHSSASLAYFHNTYHGFISTEVVAATPQGALSQAVNFSNVRIQGIEGDGELPVATRAGVFTFFGNAAWTRGDMLSGVNPLTGSSLAGTPQDNISPFKMLAGARFSDPRDRFWMEYGARVQAGVDRVAATLLESPYLIAQDLLALEGFAVHRLAWGVHFRREGLRLGLVFAIENVTDRFYREQFQFAPARGRSFTVGLRVRGF
jgi:outer membrane receptor protein involved in Fe transport